ncbi:MAG: Gfo/Idh/MocA family oxidoreductase, partial [Thermomicrobiales bacterium]|nr:Gfo/Idh/MocA family oxidoreductase [Thermomicrobiales bacterium]
MAEKSIGFGIIGLGRIGAFHAESLRTRIAGAHLVAAVVDPEHRARLLAEGAAPCALEESVEALLARADVDAVVVASPAVAHDAHIIMAARAGTPIFSEKPLADTVAKAQAAADAVA